MKYLLFAISIFLINCNVSKHTDKPEELIKFLRLEAGQPDSIYINDIFFAEKYDPEFEVNQQVSVKYFDKNGKIVFKPLATVSGFTYIKFKNNSENFILPVIVNKKSEVRFIYKPDRNPKEMYIMGNFNNWNRKGNAMLDPDGDGTYEAVVYLDEGVYEYQFVIDQREIFDPNNPEKVDNGFGYFNSIKRIVSADAGLAPNLYFTQGDRDDMVTLSLVPGPQFTEIKLFGLFDNQLLSGNIITRHDQSIELDISKLPADGKIHTVRLLATGDGQPGNVISIWIKDGKLLPAENKLWQDAIIYSLMIDRFYNGDKGNDKKVEYPELADQANFHGGDLKGIIDKLESGYFDSLGINTIWISPVNKTTNQAFREWPEPKRYFTGYHGYWPVSATEVEPRFGSMAEIKKLVVTAHQRKIKILLDFISNHTHIEHPFYQNHQEWFGEIDLPNGEKNIRCWDEFRLTTWFDTFLSSFDYLGSTEALEAMTDNAIWWIKETGIDGFRHDATKHVPYRFWRTLTRKIKSQIDPNRRRDIYQIGETFGGYGLINSYVNNGMLDAQFSFNQFFIARRVFAEEHGHFQDLAGAIEKAQKVYGDNHLMGNIMDSHDQVRMMALLDGQLSLSDDATERAWQLPPLSVEHPETYDKAYVLLTYLFTVPGIPLLYYGDEFGLTGANDPDNRRMMRFGSELSKLERGQLHRIQKLMHLRTAHSALRRGDYSTLHISKDVLIYTRGDVQGRYIIALNKSNHQKEISLNLPEWIKSDRFVSLINANKIEIKNKRAELLLSPNSSDILKIIP